MFFGRTILYSARCFHALFSFTTNGKSFRSLRSLYGVNRHRRLHSGTAAILPFHAAIFLYNLSRHGSRQTRRNCYRNIRSSRAHRLTDLYCRRWPRLCAATYFRLSARLYRRHVADRLSGRKRRQLDRHVSAGCSAVRSGRRLQLRHCLRILHQYRLPAIADWALAAFFVLFSPRRTGRYLSLPVGGILL